MEKYRIGRNLPRQAPVPVGYVEWDEHAGHVVFRDDGTLTQAEREQVLRHFVTPVTACWMTWNGSSPRLRSPT